MAELYVARARSIASIGRLCVIKRILPQYARDNELVQMFLDQARLAATLHHPNVVQIHDIGMTDGLYYFAMEYIHGQDLASIEYVTSMLATRMTGPRVTRRDDSSWIRRWSAALAVVALAAAVAGWILVSRGNESPKAPATAPSSQGAPSSGGVPAAGGAPSAGVPAAGGSGSAVMPAGSSVGSSSEPQLPAPTSR